MPNDAYVVLRTSRGWCLYFASALSYTEKVTGLRAHLTVDLLFNEKHELKTLKEALDNCWEHEIKELVNDDERNER